MEKEVQDSINKFEQKKEFREVKLQTRQSFREDQAALNTRLSSIRSKIRRRMSADEQNGEADEKSGGVDSVHSKLEDLVVNLQQAKVQNSDTSDGITEDVEKKAKAVDMIHESGAIQINGESDHSKQNGHVTREYETPVYENTRVLNGKVPGVGTQRHIVGSMTPGPRLKTSGRRIYEKNPKLTTASTEHLDNVSLRGVKTSPAQGLRVIEIKQQQIVSEVPSLPIASIPADGNLRDFNVDEMVTIFRMMNISEELLHRFSVNKVDGKRFAMFTDKDLDTLGISNPIVRYFRDRSSHRRKKGPAFVL